MLDAFIRGLAAVQPEQAGPWVDLVGDQRQREQLILVVSAAWRKRDPAAAEAWIETLELSEEMRVKIARIRPQQVRGQRLVIQQEKAP